MPTTTTIAAGSSAAVSLAANAILRLTGLGLAQLAPPGASGLDNAPRGIGASECSFGPYAMATTINITASSAGGGVSYFATAAGDVANVGGAQAMSAAQAAGITPVWIGTWAGKPAASSVAAGTPIIITDLGVGGRSWWFSDGNTWRQMQPTVTPQPALLTVVCGNSIAGSVKSTGSYIPSSSDVHLASQLSGAPLRFAAMNAATTRSDIWGTYSYSGGTLATINADLPVQWFDQITGAGIRPDLVIGHSLLENDVATDRTVAQMQADINTWLRLVNTHWPGVSILLCTPRPSFSNSTASRVLAWQQITAWLLTLDDSVSLFVAQLNGYESTTSPATPQSYSVVASRSGTTLTVTSTTDTIAVGHEMFSTPGSGNKVKITAYGTGTGGAGDYTVTVTGAPPTASSTWGASKYTDDTVHPLTNGGAVNGRTIKSTLARLGGKWVYPGRGYNPTTSGALTGTGAASGTNVTGTVPTGCSAGGSANGTFVHTALQPGWEVTFNNNATGYNTDIASFQCAAVTTIAGASQLVNYAKVQIVSGAENLAFLELQGRLYYGVAGGTNAFVKSGPSWNTGDTEPTYQNGDVLTIFSGPTTAPSGSFTQATNYVRPWLRYTAGTSTVTLRILESGCLVPETTPQVQSVTPAAAGTVTVDASLGEVVNVQLPAGNITMAAPTNAKVGALLTFNIAQDGTGGRTITWNAAFKKAADGVGGASGVGSTSFRYNGANWVQTGGALAFA